MAVQVIQDCSLLSSRLDVLLMISTSRACCKIKTQTSVLRHSDVPPQRSAVRHLVSVRPSAGAAAGSSAAAWPWGPACGAEDQLGAEVGLVGALRNQLPVECCYHS